MGNPKYNDTIIAKIMQERGQKLLSSGYKNDNSEITFQCNCGAIETRKFSNYIRTGKCTLKTHQRIIEDKEAIQKGLPLRERKSGERWIVRDIKEACDKIYGKGALDTNYIDPQMDLTNSASFKVGCNTCQFIWNTNIDYLISQKRGCGWCKDECVSTIHSYDLDMIKFIGNKIYEGLFNYDKNERKLYGRGDEIVISCNKNSDHPDFRERLGKHLSRAEGNHRRTVGCEKCKKEGTMLKPTYSKKWETLEDFIKECKSIHGEKYDYSHIDEHDIDSHENEIPLICKNIRNDKFCNNEFNVSIYDFIKKKSGCELCYIHKMTYEEFMKRATEKYKENFSFELIKKYDINNVNDKPKIKCTKCDYIEASRTVNEWINRRNPVTCKNCKNKVRWDSDKIKQYCEERSKEGKYLYPNIDFAQKFDKHTLIPIECQTCKNQGYEKYEFSQSLTHHFIKKADCKRCIKRVPWTYERFISEITEGMKQEFDYSLVIPEMITKAKDKIPIKCKNCNEIFEKSLAGHFILKEGCSKCTQSSGERMVREILNELGINFSQTETIINLQGNVCHYDFKVYYNRMVFSLEYDGIQHFKLIPHLCSSIEKFERYRNNDIYKQYMALKNGENYIRITKHRSKEKIKQHILNALNNPHRIYYSHPELYTWIDEGIKNLEKYLGNLNLENFSKTSVIQETSIIVNTINNESPKKLKLNIQLPNNVNTTSEMLKKKLTLQIEK